MGKENDQVEEHKIFFWTSFEHKVSWHRSCTSLMCLFWSRWGSVEGSLRDTRVSAAGSSGLLWDSLLPMLRQPGHLPRPSSTLRHHQGPLRVHTSDTGHRAVVWRSDPNGGQRREGTQEKHHSRPAAVVRIELWQPVAEALLWCVPLLSVWHGAEHLSCGTVRRSTDWDQAAHVSRCRHLRNFKEGVGEPVGFFTAPDHNVPNGCDTVC